MTIQFKLMYYSYIGHVPATQGIAWAMAGLLYGAQSTALGSWKVPFFEHLTKWRVLFLESMGKTGLLSQV